MSFQEYSESIRSRLHIGDLNPKLAISAVFALMVILLLGMNSLNRVASESAFAVLPPDPSAQTEAVKEDDAGDGEANAKANVAEVQEKPSNSAPEAVVGYKEICVHVDGAVKNPGICYLKEGSRVADAIASAGGETDEADISKVNLAKVIADAEKVHVPLQGETESQDTQAEVCTDPSSVIESASSKVNLNTATAEDLQSLKGIGESKAQKIIDYRNSHGGFDSVDELTNVSGIGSKTLESIRGDVCL